jgi:aminoglycoside/choline kinase family phosphotransferase
MDTAEKRLSIFLEHSRERTESEALTADASTREYFRISWKGESAIACVYPEPFDPADQPYLDVTHLLLSAGLPVANVHAVDGPLGIIVQEDLGDSILRDVMASAEPRKAKRLLGEAISLIARIQVVTEKAFEFDSIASRLRFDAEKLSWELDYFKEHYFSTYKNSPLSKADDDAITSEFGELCRELEGFASVLCHRDFHAANLMIDPKGRMRIIDHQDARIGSPTYDLVSLLLDRITEPPSPEWLAERRHYFLDVRRRLGLPKIDEDEFANEFRLQTIQRCLKAAGTFSYQSAVRGKEYFIPFIKPMFAITRRGCQSLGRFPAIREVLTGEIESL